MNQVSQTTVTACLLFKPVGPAVVQTKILVHRVNFAVPPSICSPNLVSYIAFTSRGFRHSGHSIWNSLPPYQTSIHTAFNYHLKTHLLYGASISENSGPLTTLYERF